MVELRVSPKFGVAAWVSGFGDVEHGVGAVNEQATVADSRGARGCVRWMQPASPIGVGICIEATPAVDPRMSN